MSKIEINALNNGPTAIELVDFIAEHTALSKAAIKRGLNFGGCRASGIETLPQSKIQC
jgi:hypothetical protein